MKLVARALLAAALLAALACEKKAPPPPQAPAPEKKAAPAKPAPPKPVIPWTWRPLGNLAVLEGEIPEAADLVLSGPRTYQTYKATPGRLRWEIIRPPEGEVAELRTTAGKVLAIFRFQKLKAEETEEKWESAPIPAERPAPDPPGREPPRSALDPLPEPQRQEVPRSTVEAPSTSSRAVAWRIPEPARAPELLPAVPLNGQLRAKLDLPSPRGLPALPTPGRATAPPRMEIPPPPPMLPPALLRGGWPGAGEGLHLARGPRSGKHLVLSFDGGSSSEVAGEILDALKARRVRTTIFLTGAFIQRYPALVRRMAQEGHELGNHTMNHPHLAPAGRRDPKWTRARFQQELLEADQALYALLGRPMDPLWRAPYGEQTQEIRQWAEELGYRHVGWSEGADTLDWATTADRRLYRSGAAILDRLYARLGRDGDGMIVLMHLGSARPEQDRPARSLGAFMDRAAKDGWRFVTVGSYLRELGKPAWDSAGRIAMLQPAGPRGGGSR